MLRIELKISQSEVEHLPDWGHAGLTTMRMNDEKKFFKTLNELFLINK